MDLVSDALIRIKNGYLARKSKVSLRYSKLVLKLCQVLASEGYVASCKAKDREVEVILKYEAKEPALTNIIRVSKPSLRVYKGVSRLPQVLNGLGIAIISTPNGLMTEKDARKQGVGGEIIAEVW